MVTERQPSGNLEEVRQSPELRVVAEEPIPSQPLDFAAVYEECFPSVWKKLARLGVPSAQLDDVTQDVFLAIHRRLGELRDPSKLKAWTTGFAIRAASDVRRSLHRRGPHEEVPESLAAPHQTDARFEREEGLAVLQAALAKLPDDQREVFVLIELEEMSGPEVSMALELNLNTVYSRLRLARAAFNAIVDATAEEGR